MHPALLRAFDDQLPRLQAAEQLRLLEAVSIATGRTPRPDAQRIVSDLFATANPGWRTRGAQRPETLGQLEQLAAATGIGVRRVTPEGAG